MILAESHWRARPRLLISAGVGLAVALSAGGIDSTVTRALVGWNASVWLFLVLLGTMMLRADHEHMRRTAIAHAEGAATVLAVVVIAAVASIVAIIFELSSARQPGAPNALPHALFALATVSGAWLLVPALFAMNYASLYYAHNEQGVGLQFPGADAGFKPDYTDFLYFSFTIAVALQTADVSISTRKMRRLVLLHALLSFVFNTTILAFTINIAASLF
jgi:uncharacterized membrane protein